MNIHNGPGNGVPEELEQIFRRGAALGEDAFQQDAVVVLIIVAVGFAAHLLQAHRHLLQVVLAERNVNGPHRGRWWLFLIIIRLRVGSFHGNRGGGCRRLSTGRERQLCFTRTQAVASQKSGLESEEYKTCVRCGTMFEINPNYPQRKYCSPQCRKKESNRRHKERYSQ